MKKEATLIYFADPMCSWCWGAAPAISQLKEKYSDNVYFKLVMGGLRPHNTKKMSEKAKESLLHHWQEIGEMTGQPFQYHILDNEDFIYDTEPATRAVVTIREIKAEIEFDFFKKVQYAFYAENHNPTKTKTYEAICNHFDVDYISFKERFESEEMKEKTEDDFDFTRQFGVSGFPALILQLGEKAKPVARGYLPYEQLIQNFEMQWNKLESN